jgi:hypothetical protein
MANSYKALAIAHELADRLKQRLPAALKVTESFDTDGNPLISINDGTPIAGEANAILKVAAIAWPEVKDVLGLDQTVFTPHVISLATEADYAGATDNVADPMTRAQLLPILGQALAMGCRVDWYESATGVAPSAATIADATKLKATYQPDVYHALVSNQ